MIYFIEHDAEGNIVHVCSDPVATIVPLINRVVFNDKSGKPLLNAQGYALSPFESPLIDPVGISKDIYDGLMKDGIAKFMYNSSTNTVSKKVN